MPVQTPQTPVRENRPRPSGGSMPPVAEEPVRPRGNAPKQRGANTPPPPLVDEAPAPEPKPSFWDRIDPDKYRRLRRVTGLFLMIFSLFLMVSLVAHFFAGQEDQSVVEYGPVPAPSADTAAQNSGGSVGAWVSHVLITQGYGFVALFLPPFLFLLGYAVMEWRIWAVVRKLFVYEVFGLHWVSFAFGFITAVFELSSPDWGGGVGLSLTEWTATYIGLPGVALVLLFSLLAFAVARFNAELPFFGVVEEFAAPGGEGLKGAFARLWRRGTGQKVDETPEDEPAHEDDGFGVENRAAMPGDILHTEIVKPEDLPPFPAANDEDEEELEGGFILSVRKVQEPTTVPTTGDAVLPPVWEQDAAENHTHIPLAERKTDSGWAQQQPPTEPALEVPTAGADEGWDNPLDEVERIEFVIEAPKAEPQIVPTPAELPPFPIASSDNLTQVAPATFEKIIQPEDQPVLGAGDTVEEEWEAYDPTRDLRHYRYPTLDLLKPYDTAGAEVNRAELEANKSRIIRTLQNYNIEITSIKATIGPTVTLYEIVPAPGVRISKIKGLEDDIALSLAALGIRIIAPMPGKGTIGIEIPNSKPETVGFRSLVATEKFRDTQAALPIAIGKTISNEVFIADLAKMPHLLVAGSTGQGKSVGLNCIIASLLYKKHPSQVKFVLIDPKKVEMTLYNALRKHFLAKLPNYEDAIITDNKQAVQVLTSLCIEMDNRYELLKEAGVRNIVEYNEKFVARKLNPRKGHKYLPYLVLVVDELADLMMTAGKEVEAPIIRLAQLGRAAGLHLIIATQRPSVNVITGIIKANFPARLSYRVISKIDSRTILDTNGAEQLIGRGDLLLSTGTELIRIQNAFVDTPEIDQLVNFIANQTGYPEPYLLPEVVTDESDNGNDDAFDSGEMDPLFEESARLMVRTQQGSTSLIQRKLSIGYNRAGRIMDQLERAGICGPASGSKPRDVLVYDEAALEQVLMALKRD